jgi:hypothetical protein
MRSLGGFVLLAGIGVGLFVYLPAPVDSSLSLEQVREAIASRAEPALPVVRAAPATTPRAQSVAQPKLRSFSPNISLASLAHTEVTAASDTGAQLDSAGSWQAVVTTTSSAVASSGSLTPRDSDSRYKLVTDIQQQLKRVGCYYGRIDGSWNANTKDAMRTFTDRINAELPLDEPDYLLLTLAQAYAGKACGECPPGLAPTANGRCIPQPTVAQSRPADAHQPAAPATAAAGSTGEVLPWQVATNGPAKPVAGRPLFTPIATSMVSSEPLPGRMSIGGPRDLPAVDAANADPVLAPTSNGQPVGANGLPAVQPGVTPGAPARPAAQHRPKKEPSYARTQREGPGTPRYNLLLSLGGAY